MGFTIQETKDSGEIEKLVELITNEWGADEDTGLNDDNLFKVLVVTDDSTGEILGGLILHTIYWWPSICKWFFVSFLIIKKEYRGTGLGTALIDRCKEITSAASLDPETEYEDRFADTIELALYAEKWNNRTRKFYENRGFVYQFEDEDVYPVVEGQDPNNTAAVVYTWTPPPVIDSLRDTKEK